ncbi:MAG: hypothetical protein WBM09_04690, partial [Gallionella sp.]
MADLFEIKENHIQLSEGYSNNTIDLAARCIGLRLSKKFPESNIVGKLLIDGIGGIGVYDKNHGDNTFGYIVVISHNHIQNFLLVEKKILKIYKQLNKIHDFEFKVFDIENKLIYSFDTLCEENQGYYFDGASFIFDTNYAKAKEEIEAGELMELSLGADT